MSLRDIGVDSVPERIYRALLTNTGLTIAELSGSVGSDVADTGRAVAEMIELQILAPEGRAACGAVARHPGVAFTALLARREAELQAQQLGIDRVRAEVARLCDDLADHAGRGVDTLDHPDAVAQQVAGLLGSARTGVSCVHPESWATPSNTAVPSRLILAPISPDTTSPDMATELRVPHLGRREVRYRPRPLDRLLLVDERVAILPEGTEGRPDTALVVRHGGLLRGLVTLFDDLWTAAGPSPAVDGPTDDERALLALLGAGRTDESIAREIAISVRQLRRRITVLMARLDARSRFEAGVLAADRGWI